MDAKRILIMTVVLLAVGTETSYAAMPFGRLMPLHYGPDDIRTVVVPQTEKKLSFSSLPKNSLSTSRLSPAPAPGRVGLVTFGDLDAFWPFLEIARF
jgi:hypothetical protein